MDNEQREDEEEKDEEEEIDVKKRRIIGQNPGISHEKAEDGTGCEVDHKEEPASVPAVQSLLWERLGVLASESQ